MFPIPRLAYEQLVALYGERLTSLYYFPAPLGFF